MSNDLSPGTTNLSDKDDSTISQEEINKIRSRYELEEQKQKAIEDLNSTYQQQRHNEQNKLVDRSTNRTPLAAGGGVGTPLDKIATGSNQFANTPSNNNNTSIYNPKFSHYTERKKKKILEQARSQLESQRNSWYEDERRLVKIIKDKQAQKYAAAAHIHSEFKKPISGSDIHKLSPSLEMYRSIGSMANLGDSDISAEVYENKTIYELRLDPDKREYLHYLFQVIGIPDPFSLKRSVIEKSRFMDLFPQKQVILDAYKKQFMKLSARDNNTAICNDCLEALMSSRDRLYDIANMVEIIKKHRQ